MVNLNGISQALLKNVFKNAAGIIERDEISKVALDV